MNPLSPEFWQLYGMPLAGGLATALACSVLSVFVVLRRMSFIGEGIAHAAFGGVGVALLASLVLADLRWPLARDLIVSAFCMATALGIGVTARRGRLGEDTSIGIWLVAGMALGVVLLDIRGYLLQGMLAAGQLTRGQVGYAPSFENLLFGDILFLSGADAAWAAVVAALAVLGVVAFFKELVFFAFDEEASAVFGVPTTALYYGLLVLLSISVVAAMRSLGVILAAALLILPGASARMWSHRIGMVTALSVVIGVAGVAGGFVLAVWAGFLSTGPVIVLALTAIFAASWLATTARRRLRNGRSRQ
jgi:ABC-type Mn2+/Zn2+ transport system permease subunit